MVLFAVLLSVTSEGTDTLKVNLISSEEYPVSGMSTVNHTRLDEPAGQITDFDSVANTEPPLRVAVMVTVRGLLGVKSMLASPTTSADTMIVDPL